MPSAAVRFDRGSPTIAIINESSDVSAARLRRAVAALQKQVDRDFFPLWGWRAELRFETSIPPRAMRLTLKEIDTDEADDGALGYHFIDGVPRTEVYTRDAHGKRYSESDVFSTMSHEVLEMIADPGANLYADGFYMRGKRRYRAMVSFEVCDPVQDRTYEIDTIRVSDFVLPEWFEPEREPGSMKFSFRGAVREPFALTPGGYIDALVGNAVHTVWGRKANKRKRRHRRQVRAAKH